MDRTARVDKQTQNLRISLNGLVEDHRFRVGLMSLQVITLELHVRIALRSEERVVLVSAILLLFPVTDRSVVELSVFADANGELDAAKAVIVACLALHVLAELVPPLV